MKIYLVHPISGLSYTDVVDYYDGLSSYLSDVGYETLCPMTGKGHLRNEVEFKAHGFTQSPISTNRAIVGRDHWMVSQADIVHVDLYKSEWISIGSISELAWAFHMKKHTIVVMEDEKNIHQHAFVLEMADIIFPSLTASMDYLTKIDQGTIVNTLRRWCPLKNQHKNLTINLDKRKSPIGWPTLRLASRA